MENKDKLCNRCKIKKRGLPWTRYCLECRKIRTLEVHKKLDGLARINSKKRYNSLSTEERKAIREKYKEYQREYQRAYYHLKKKKEQPTSRDIS